MRRRALISLVAAACSDATLVDTHAVASVDPELDLGSGYVGDLLSGRFGLEATGTGWISVNAVTPSLDALVVDFDAGAPRARRLLPGDRLEIGVSWQPQAPGVLAASVAVALTAESGEVWTVAVRGEARAVPSCDDGNSCTTDVFDRERGRCRHTPHEQACDDGSACTVQDACVDGVCRGRALRCDDGDVCTLNLCDPAVGCVHPPDGRICDDDDPCTTDLCHPERGCEHPDAPDGTACGPFDCATGHLCWWGECRSVSLVGVSDGYPCSDGDRCTDGDVCQDGACVAGAYQASGPVILSSFETFGGRGSTVGSDGYRFAFADPDALRFAVPGAGGALEHVSTLAVRSAVPPVALEAGRFLVGGPAGVGLVDASRVHSPALAWQVLPDSRVTHLALVQGGAALYDVAGAAATSSQGVERVAPPAVLYFLPLAAGTATPGAPVPLSETAYDLLDLDASGDVVAWLQSASLHWQRIDASGQARARGVLVFEEPFVPARLSVEGSRVAVLASDRIDVFAATEAPGECDCPCSICDACEGCSIAEACGSECAACLERGCTASVSFAPLASLSVASASIGDVVLSWPRVYGVGPEGAVGWALEGDAPLAGALDAMPGVRLERGPELLLVAGDLALPLSLAAPADLPASELPAAARLTGRRHGDVAALNVGSDGRILVAGPAALGRLAAHDGSVQGWGLADRAANHRRLRLLRGPERDTLVGHRVDITGGAGGLPHGCLGPEIEIVEDGLATSTRVVCELYKGPVDVARGSLLSYSTLDPSPEVLAAQHLCVHGLLPDPSPSHCSFTHADNTTDESFVRASDGGDGLIEISITPHFARMRLFLAPLSPDPATTEFSLTPVPLMPFDRLRIAADGSRWLLGGAGVQLFQGSSLLSELIIEGAAADRPARVPWMHGGRAWVEWTAPERNVTLRQVTYSAASELAAQGDVALPGTVQAMIDLGQTAVVATGRHVLLIGAACP